MNSSLGLTVGRHIRGQPNETYELKADERHYCHICASKPRRRPPTTKTSTAQRQRPSKMFERSGGKYCCLICGMAYMSRTGVYFHMSEHDPVPTVHLCSDCGSTFKNPRSLRKHTTTSKSCRRKKEQGTT